MDPDISIVVPLFNESENVAPLTERIFGTFRDGRRTIELLLVDDGSTDQADAVNPTGNSVADVQRLLEQATFGPTSALTAAVQTSGIDSYLNQQFNAPMQDYPDLPFWPQTRPSTCIDTCQRDNYTYYQVQRHFFANALGGDYDGWQAAVSQ